MEWKKGDLVCALINKRSSKRKWGKIELLALCLLSWEREKKRFKCTPGGNWSWFFFFGGGAGWCSSSVITYYYESYTPAHGRNGDGKLINSIHRRRCWHVIRACISSSSSEHKLAKLGKDMRNWGKLNWFFFRHECGKDNSCAVLHAIVTLLSLSLSLSLHSERAQCI